MNELFGKPTTMEVPMARRTLAGTAAATVAPHVAESAKRNAADGSAVRAEQQRKNKIEASAKRMRDELHAARADNSALIRQVKAYQEVAHVDLLAVEADIVAERKIHSELESKLARLRRMTNTL